MEAWCPTASRLIHASLAHSTRRAYEGAWRDYKASMLHGVGGEVFSYKSVLQFIATQWGAGKSLALVQRQMSAIAFYAGLAGAQDPTKHFAVRKALRGWQRMRPHKEDARRPICEVRLAGILGVLPGICSSAFEVGLFQVAYSLAFFGALRVSELVAARPSGVSGGLEMRDVVVGAEALRIRLRRSKTDQGGRGAWIQLAAAPGSPCCPVALVRAYLGARPSTVHPNLLVHLDGGPLTCSQFTTICKRAIARLGDDPAHFTSHSFRIGAATTAAGLGFSEASVKGVGRWKSDCFQLYVRPHLL